MWVNRGENLKGWSKNPILVTIPYTLNNDTIPVMQKQQIIIKIKHYMTVIYLPIKPSRALHCIIGTAH